MSWVEGNTEERVTEMPVDDVLQHQSSTFQFSTLGAETADDPPSMTVTAAPAYH